MQECPFGTREIIVCDEILFHAERPYSIRMQGNEIVLQLDVCEFDGIIYRADSATYGNQVSWKIESTHSTEFAASVPVSTKFHSSGNSVNQDFRAIGSRTSAIT